MKLINWLSISAIPIIILIIVTEASIEKNKVFDDFTYGVRDGIKIIINLFPTLLGLFIAIGAMRTSGIIDFFVNIFSTIIEKNNFPKEIMPLVFLRPISGSGAMAIATDIMKKFGVDSNIGIIASVIMGSTETTIYTIAVYNSSVGIKKTRFVLWAALIADAVGILVSVVVCRILS